MVLSQAERARKIVKWYARKNNIPMSRVGEMVGYSNASAFSHVLNGEKKLPDVLASRLSALDPEINPGFLAGLTDEMLRNDGVDGEPQAGQVPEDPAIASQGVWLPAELVGMFRDMATTVRSQQETISALVKASLGEAAPKKGTA